MKVADNLGEAADALRAWLAELDALPGAAGDLCVKGLVGRPRTLCRLACSELLWSHGIEDVAGTTFETMIDDVVSGRSARYALGGVEWELAAGVLKVVESSAGWGESLRPLEINGTRTESGLAAEYVKVDATLWASLSRGDILPTHEVYLSVTPSIELAWRSRLPGDRYQPLGSTGTAKVSDLLIDRKVPRELREQLPVIIINSDVIWVPGAPPADSLRLTGPCEKALRLTWQSPRLRSNLPR
jgi:tRNA(Ile)-lysidine synthetase-like protein